MNGIVYLKIHRMSYDKQNAEALKALRGIINHQ